MTPAYENRLATTTLADPLMAGRPRWPDIRDPNRGNRELLAYWLAPDAGATVLLEPLGATPELSARLHPSMPAASMTINVVNSRWTTCRFITGSPLTNVVMNLATCVPGRSLIGPLLNPP